MVPRNPTSDEIATIHNASFIHDYYPLALPLMVDEEMIEFMDRALAAGTNGNAVIYGFFDFYLRRMEAGGEPGREMRRRLEAAARQAGVDAITLTLGNASRPLDDYDSILESARWWERMIAAAPFLAKCSGPKDLEEARRAGKIGLLFALQDMGCIGTDLARLGRLAELGVRMGQLTYNGANAIGAGCAVDPTSGLTPFGKEAVREMNRLGIAVDLSHCNRRTTLDGIAASTLPVAVSHSSCASVWAHARAKSDDELRALADNDGYFGVFTVPFFLCGEEEPDFSIFIRHLERAVSLVGPGRVGVGSDWGLWSPDVPKPLTEAAIAAALKMGFSKDMRLAAGVSLKGMTDYTHWIAITGALARAGFSESELVGLLGGNYLRFLERAAPE